MNRTDPIHPHHAEALQARFGRRIASRLEEASRQTAPGIDERLRFAREQALARARESRRSPNAIPVAAGLLAGGWLLRVASVVPILLLVAGLAAIHERHVRSQIQAAADIDAALLADDLPPGAYADPGFAAFLRTETQ